MTHRERAEAAAMLGVTFRNVPQWAQDLTRKVCTDHQADLPYVDWKMGRSYGSSGVCYHEKALGIVVRVGVYGEAEQRFVLLHELGHWLTPGHHHDETFYHQAFLLYRRYGVDLQYAQRRESKYKATGGRVGRVHILAAEGWF